MDGTCIVLQQPLVGEWRGYGGMYGMEGAFGTYYMGRIFLLLCLQLAGH